MSHRDPRRTAFVLSLVSVCALLAGGPAAADDRDLLRDNTGNPYVFIIFDTSGSMHWTPKCTQEQLDAGICDFLCETGDCYAFMHSDDPKSKFYQSKAALSEVLGSVNNVHFGFATYNQDEFRVRAKHWLYQFSDTKDDGTAQTGITLDSGRTYPGIGAPEVFGLGWACNVSQRTSPDSRGCFAENPADLDDAWEVQRMQVWPKHCSTQGDCDRTYYIRDENADGSLTTYRVTILSQDDKDNWPYGGAKYRAPLRLERCVPGTRCEQAGDRALIDEKHVFYDLEGEFLSWDFQRDRGPERMGFFSESLAADPIAQDTCDGLDLNDDVNADPYPDLNGYNLRWPTDTSDIRDDAIQECSNNGAPCTTDDDCSGNATCKGTVFDFGDLMPLDWNDDHKADLMARLEPGGRFDISPLFNDDTLGTCSNDNTTQCFKDIDCNVVDPTATCTNREDFLRLKDDAIRPIIADGFTPLGGAVRDFRVWYTGCDHGNCPKDTGWFHIASEQDPDWGCRKKFLIVLTDGDETCNGPDACSGTAGLRAQTGIKTYVVAFGVDKGNNRMRCMAANGGTGQPIFPQNKDELVKALLDIFTEIRIAARSFASASVPTVQNETSDKIFLSSFTPLEVDLDNDGETDPIAVWPGRLDAYRKPLPLNDDDTPCKPKEDGTCTCCCEQNDLNAACWLWNVGEELLDQAPTPIQANNGDLKIGMLATQRRVIYSMEADPNDAAPNVPSTLRLFQPPPFSSPPTNPEIALWYDMWRGLGLIDRDVIDGALTGAQETAATGEMIKVIGNTLKIKTVTVPDPDMIEPDQVFTYVLGDVFHADPGLYSNPNDLRFFRQDLPSCDPGSCNNGNDCAGYRQFVDDNFWRRKMLVIAANDGQLHFFDAGTRTVVFDPDTDTNVARFTDGTGMELFSYMPRLVMPVVGQQFNGSAVLDPEVVGDHIYSMDGLLTIADVTIDPLHNGTNNTVCDRGWRTVLIAGLREGGDVMAGNTIPRFKSGYFALDLTQPDKMATPAQGAPDPRMHPTPVGALLPSCLDFDTGTGGQLDDTECETPAGSNFRFPVELWTFTDRIGDPANSDRDLFELDEDNGVGNGFADLADSWSKPVVGQILLCDGIACDPNDPTNDGDLETRFVAIFGGGLETNNPRGSRRGNWLYMLDVETGSAIYKRQLNGSAAANPTVLDRDQDGLLDVIYIPTNTGHIYKVDLTALNAAGEVPALEDIDIDNNRLLGDPLGAGQKLKGERITDPAWDPFPIFVAKLPADANGKPIFMTITAMLVPQRDQFALVVGTGNRPKLWDTDGSPGRFYNFVDDDFVQGDATLPRDEADYVHIAFDGANVGPDVNFLIDPPGGLSPGWIMDLPEDDRVITQAFALVSVLIFTSFQPIVTNPVDDDGNPLEVCARTGTSRAFVVDATNGDAFTDLDLDSATVERFITVGDFTTTPYVDQVATKNPVTGGGGRNTGNVMDAQQLALQDAIRDALKKYFPETCRYNDQFAHRVNTNLSDTTHKTVATIPIAMCPMEWKMR